VGKMHNAVSGPVVSENSIPCSAGAMVVAQQPAQPLAATNVGAADTAMFGRDQFIAKPLVVSLAMVVPHELVEDPAQAPFAEEN
jgi:hypothetical protein